MQHTKSSVVKERKVQEGEVQDIMMKKKGSVAVVGALPERKSNAHLMPDGTPLK